LSYYIHLNADKCKLLVQNVIWSFYLSYNCLIYIIYNQSDQSPESILSASGHLHT